MPQVQINQLCFMFVIQKCGEYIIQMSTPGYKSPSDEFPSNTKQSQFNINGKRLSLTTSCSVSIIQPPQDTSIKLINYPCQLKENQLVKYFRITYKDTMIYVEDKFSIDVQLRTFQKQQPLQGVKREQQTPLNIKKRGKNKKTIIFKQRASQSVESNQKIDKKNTVKNVVNAFYRHLKAGKLGDQIPEQIKQAIQMLIEKKKFNNKLIKSLVDLKTIRDYFKRFLSLEAINWIQNSKLNAKQTYKQAILLYGNLCSEKDKSQQTQNKITPQQRGSSSSSNAFGELGNYELQDQLKTFN